MSTDRAVPGLTVLKTLFAESNNVCSFFDPNNRIACEERLTDPSWQRVKANVCHIRGEAPGSTRYDPYMTNEERCAYENLILMCPNHHTLIDDLEPGRFTVQVLTEMKYAARERRMTERPWTTDDQLIQSAVLLREATAHLLSLVPIGAGSLSGSSVSTSSSSGELTAKFTGTAGVGAVGSDALRDPDRPLTQQINQVLGYGQLIPLGVDEEGRTTYRVRRVITSLEVDRLRVLATERGVTMLLIHEGGSSWLVRPASMVGDV